LRDQSQKSLRNDGQKTANSLGKSKYFSHLLRQAGLRRSRSGQRIARAKVAGARRISRFLGSCQRAKQRQLIVHPKKNNGEGQQNGK
jgi:hypothetical protein